MLGRKAKDRAIDSACCFPFPQASWDIPPESAIPCFSILERDCEVELAHADEEVDATTADSKIAELLAVAPGTPLPRIRQVIHSTKGKTHRCPRLLSLRSHAVNPQVPCFCIARTVLSPFFRARF
jgi:hypothetical protein